MLWVGDACGGVVGLLPDEIAVPSALYPPLPPGHAPLRIALLLAAGAHAPELEPVLQLLAACELASIALLVRYRLARQRRTESRVFALFRMLDRRLARRHRESGDTALDPRTFYPEAGILDCEAEPMESGHGLPKAMAEDLRAADLDVIIALDRGDWQGTILSMARHGVWHYRW